MTIQLAEEIYTAVDNFLRDDDYDDPKELWGYVAEAIDLGDILDRYNVPETIEMPYRYQFLEDSELYEYILDRLNNECTPVVEHPIGEDIWYALDNSARDSYNNSFEDEFAWRIPAAGKRTITWNYNEHLDEVKRFQWLAKRIEKDYQ